MKYAKILVVLVLAAMLPFSGAQAKPAVTASSVVKTFYDRLTDTMKQGESLGYAGRYKKLEPAVKAAFDMPLMTKFAVGPAWQGAKDDEQRRLISAFTAFSVANYASQFKKYDGEKFDILGEKPAAGGGVIVETTLTPEGEAPVSLNYVVREDASGKLKIVDVLLDGSISQLATRRSEFNAIIKRDGIDALITSISEKTKKMGVS